MACIMHGLNWVPMEPLKLPLRYLQSLSWLDSIKTHKSTRCSLWTIKGSLVSIGCLHTHIWTLSKRTFHTSILPNTKKLDSMPSTLNFGACWCKAMPSPHGVWSLVIAKHFEKNSANAEDEWIVNYHLSHWLAVMQLMEKWQLRRRESIRCGGMIRWFWIGRSFFIDVSNQ